MMMTKTVGNVAVLFEEPRDGSQDGDVIVEVWDDRTYRWRPEDMAGRAVLDLGANIGAFSLWAVACGAGRVRAVEPDPANVERLRRHLEINGAAERVEVVAAAAAGRTWRKPERTNLTQRPSGAGSWTAPDATPGSIEVPACSLDALLSDMGDSVLVKCDIEGAEFDLIRWAQADTLRRIDRLAMEFHNPGAEGGIGERESPAEGDNPFGDLVTRLAQHHSVTTFGEPARGGLIWADRY